MSLFRPIALLPDLISGILRLCRLPAMMAALLLVTGTVQPMFATERELPVRNVVKPGAGLDPAERVGPIVLSNMPAPQVFGLLQTYSGRVVLQSAGIPNAQLNFNSQGKMRRDEAIFALENLLLLNGIALMEVDERFIRAIPANQSTRGAPHLLNKLPEDGETAEQVYSKVFPLKHIDSNVAVRYIGPLVSPGGMGTVINLNMSDSILVIDRLSNLEFFENLLETLDRPVETRQEIYYFPANNTNAWQLRSTLLQIRGSTHRVQLNRSLFWVDARTNMLVVSTDPENYEMIKNLVEELDKEVAPLTTSQVFPIRNTNVWTVYRILQGIVNNQQRIFNRMGFYSGERFGRQAQDEEVPFLVTTDGTAPAPSTEGAAPGVPTSVEQRVETMPGLEQLAEQPIMGEGMPELQFSPYLSLYADPQNSSIVVYGTQADMQRVEYLIKELDQRSAPMTESEVFYLEHAEANTLASLIGRTIQIQRSAFRREGLRSGRERQADDELTPDIFEEGFQFSPFASVVADRRSNALLVYGTKEDIRQVKELVERTDIQVAPMTHTKVFPLRHTEVMNMARIVTSIINGQQSRLRQVQSQSQRMRTRGAGDDPDLDSDFTEGAYDLQFSPFAMVIADRRSNTLVAYGTPGDMSHLEDLLKRVDIEVAPVTQSRVFYLEQANANTLASILNRIVQGQQRAMRNVLSLQRQIHNLPDDDDDDGLAQVLIEGDQTLQFSPYINIVANQRSNSIIVYGTESDVDQLAELIRMNDIKIAPRTSSRTFFIKHAQANTVVRVINPLIQAQLRVRERESTLRRVFLREGEGADSEIGPLEFPASADATGVQDLGYTEQLTEQLMDPSRDYDEDAQFSPYVSLAADERSNSVIAYGTPFDLDQIEALIEQIDRILPQVRIEVVIAEVALVGGASSGLSEFGINYRAPFDPLNPGIGDIGMMAEGDNPAGSQDPFFEGGLSLGRFSLQSVFRVAREKSNVKILSAPTITTTHNRLARINIGEARPIITSTVSNVSSTTSLATRSEVEYRDIGIELKVRPLISEGNIIQMELEQIVETVVGTQTIDNNVQPIIGTRRATSFLSIRDQEVLVMGGLQAVESTDREGRVWLLGDIPILGQLFQPTNREQTVRELIIFIRPYIVQSSDEASLLASEALENTAIGEEVEYYLREGNFREQELIRPPSAAPIPMEGTLLPVLDEGEDPDAGPEVSTEAVLETRTVTEAPIEAETDVENEETMEPDSDRRPTTTFRRRR